MAEEIKNNNAASEMDWDSGISADVNTNEFNLPPVGEYGFRVIEFNRKFSKAGNKMAELKLELDESAQFWKVYDYLVLTDKNAWKLATFFEAVSLKKKGEALDRMPWDKVLGATGRVKIKHETYDGKESCKVDRYIVSEASKAPTKPASITDMPSDKQELPFEV